MHFSCVCMCVLYAQMLTRICYVYFLHKVMLHESIYLWPESENSTKIIIILQRSTEKPVWKFCNDTGQRKQRVDIFWLCSHALGPARPRCSWQQSEHTALRAPGSAFSQHPAMERKAWVFTRTSSPRPPTQLNHGKTHSLSHKFVRTFCISALIAR